MFLCPITPCHQEAAHFIIADFAWVKLYPLIDERERTIPIQETVYRSHGADRQSETMRLISIGPSFEAAGWEQ